MTDLRWIVDHCTNVELKSLDDGKYSISCRNGLNTYSVHDFSLSTAAQQLRKNVEADL